MSIDYTFLLMLLLIFTINIRNLGVKNMKILYYDCFSGISGDMNLAALIDLGIKKEYLISELKKLNLDEYDINVTRDSRKGINGTKVEVVLHEHEHDETEAHEHHHHRNFRDIEKIINESSLSDDVKKLSLNIFSKVASAEAKVHNEDIYEVHFHEVGAVDSIVDIIGAAICIDYLKLDLIMCSSVEVGSGFVKCAHGVLPVPAPATAEILRGIPIKSSGVPFEATTPTGAAILSTIVNEFNSKNDFLIKKIGYGIGHKDEGSIPNILRVFLGEKRFDEKEQKDTLSERAFIIESNIDDMNPEVYDYIMEKLFEMGSMDVYMTPIIMKKERPATKISVLCSGEIFSKVEELLLKETTALGLRYYEVTKTMLKRESSVVKTMYGDIKVKTAIFKGEKIKYKPEYDDCKKIAIENNIPIQNVYKEVMRCI